MWPRAGVCMICALLGGLSAVAVESCTERKSENGTEVLDVGRGVRLKGRGGVLRGVLSEEASGAITLALFDGKGQRQLKLSVDRDGGASLSVGSEGIRLGSSATLSAITIVDGKTLKPALGLFAYSGDQREIVMYGKDGMDDLRLLIQAAGKGGQCDLAFWGGDEKEPRVRLWYGGSGLESGVGVRGDDGSMVLLR